MCAYSSLSLHGQHGQLLIRCTHSPPRSELHFQVSSKANNTNGQLKELTWTKLDNAWSCNITCNRNLTRNLSMAVNHYSKRHATQDNWLLTFHCQNQSSSKAQSGGVKSVLELAIHPGQPHHPCFIYNKAWLHLLLYQHGCFWKYQKLFTGTLQMAARACSNHQTTPPVSPAKRGAVMSPLHEGSVNDMSWCTGWHTNCTCSTRTGE